MYLQLKTLTCMLNPCVLLLQKTNTPCFLRMYVCMHVCVCVCVCVCVYVRTLFCIRIDEVDIFKALKNTRPAPK